MAKFNDEVTKKIVTAYENGLPLKACANFAGVSRVTINNWVNKGKTFKTGKYHDFYLAMEQARSKFLYYHLKKINDSEDWKAHKYLLEVTDPDNFVIIKKQELNAAVTSENKTINTFDSIDKQVKELKDYNDRSKDTTSK